ncbi:DUF433 domain-containing protein [Methylobacterium organophilum]|uniref:DUF433 domain-containing protein n=1 Tax=Methylobacterium organophilum TaxID=410 RepID=A0ABQ4TH83_METOR|nr:DUF433 domain-containing protein [Methylobacterium organophilum]GJE29687.1 hypothetical protein LKMONMHP_4571 [Methylobacterium organophilum]
MPETWTIAQAALIVEKPVAVLQKVVERAPVRPKMVERGGRRIRAFDLHDLVFLQALDTLKRDLTPLKQAEIYEALAHLPPESPLRDVEAGDLRYDFGPYLRSIRSRIDETDRLLALIDASGREPVVKGTSIEAYRIAALFDGMSLGEILRDYPSLTEEQARAAKAYADSHPKPGRPYPTVTAKKALRDARTDDDEAFLPSRG